MTVARPLDTQTRATTLAKAGAHVYVADRDTAGGARVAEALRTGKGSAEFVELDVTDEAAIGRLAGTIDAKHGALDILVNNAGIGHVGTVVTTAGADMDRLYAVNVRGVFNTSKAFIGGMLAFFYFATKSEVSGALTASTFFAFCASARWMRRSISRT